MMRALNKETREWTDELKKVGSSSIRLPSSLQNQLCNLLWSSLLSISCPSMGRTRNLSRPKKVHKTDHHPNMNRFVLFSGLLSIIQHHLRKGRSIVTWLTHIVTWRRERHGNVLGGSICGFLIILVSGQSGKSQVNSKQVDQTSYKREDLQKDPNMTRMR